MQLELPEDLETVTSARLPDARYIPIVSLRNQETWCWRYLEVEVVAIRAAEVLRDQQLRGIKDVHEYLGFDGFVLLSSIMPDELLYGLSVQKYAELAQQLRVDAALMLDASTYMDVPKVWSWWTLSRALRSLNALADAEVPVVGLVRGADTDQERVCLQAFREAGVEAVVYPVRELWLTRHKQRVTATYLQRMIAHLSDPHRYGFAQVGIHGGGSWPRQVLKHYPVFQIGYDWWLLARRGASYTDPIHTISLLDPYNAATASCTCPVCRGRFFTDLSLGELAAHNLYTLLHTSMN